MEWRLLSAKYPDSSYLTFEHLEPGEATKTRLNRSYPDYVIKVRRPPDAGSGAESREVSLPVTSSVIILKDDNCL